MAQTGQVINSVYGPDGNRIAEFDFDPVAGTSTLIREYVWFEGKPVAVVEGGVVYFVRSDHIGKPVFATDGAGAKVWEATYLPFGGVHTSSGSPIALRFPGQWFQSESGLHQNWMRDYDPTTGRYIQADPLGLTPGPSLYGYAGQNPMRYTDPTGECPWCVAAVAGAAIGAALSLLEQLNDNSWQFECVNWWQVGGSAAAGAAFSGAGYAATGAKRAGKEFSHAIPARWLKKFRAGRWLDKRGNPYRRLNGNHVSNRFHARTDPYRRLSGPNRTLPLPARLPARTPAWAYGGPVGAWISSRFFENSCECSNE